MTTVSTKSTKKPGEIRIIQTGDIHLCQKRTPTANIIRTLNYIFYEKENLAEVDLVIIAGDVWDTLVTMPNDDALLGRQWIRRFVQDCERHGVILDVLEGTPDHDWEQSSEFVAFETGCDVRHIKTLQIVRHESLDLNILYVPDEWRPTIEAIWEDVCVAMAESGLDRVDLAVVHGGFDFNFPPEYNIKGHSAERFSGIVKHAVFANHIHKAQSYLKVHGPGSPDRLAQGEEGDKGYHRVVIDQKTEQIRIQWIKNPHAWTHMAINVAGMSVEEIVAKVKALAAPLRAGSYLRLDNGDPLVVKAVLIALRMDVKHVILEYKNKKQAGITQTHQTYSKKFSGTHINRNNAADSVVGWLQGKGLADASQAQFLGDTLKRAMALK
ncbi:DNA repair exonuclease [Erwinia phage AH06]|nr:DNA repair exonuclease [Erwinia phage AH06]